MAETYKKVDDHLEVTSTNIREVTELELLEEKQRLEKEKMRAEKEVARVQTEIAVINDKLIVINK